ncbi:response regulator transcription factor [Sphingobacterium bovistauri]|uniref:HTH luxR-type domain-containing protein n=1 Tax=Sphingobacterium bovistauri TaxID=2781959 RepID=A0ABS7Z7U2_9SPHI|nr:helix-turn-helix transcriptional regulator [Sphingobacterium bovistauri]MCA5004769.1 hypothetical protein [Sphingobacterium bovistauri]
MEDSRKKMWDFWYNHNEYQKQRNESVEYIHSNIFYFILDCYTNEFDFLSENIESFAGYSVKEFNIDVLIDNIHEDDQEFVANCERLSIDYQNTLFYDEHFKYSYSYSFRFNTRDKGCLVFNLSYEALEVNNQGYLAKSLVRVKVEELAPDYRVDRLFSIYDKTNAISINFNNINKLTKREREILDLINKGLTSAEIANKLFLSKMTVDTHRRNILYKTDSSNFIDLLNKIKTI